MEYAAQQGDIDSLYRLIEQNPHILEEIDLIPFVETPLHAAARAGHVQFAKEIMILKPSFSWKFSPQGLTPVHLALQNRNPRMVFHLIQMDTSLVRAKMRGGLTLLHLASQSGDINLLTVFLKVCPDSIQDLTSKNETALHLYKRFEVLEFLLRWLKRNIIELQTILKQKNLEGNTILHIAATKNDTKAMGLLIEVMRDLDAANLMDQRAFDIINNQDIKNNLLRAEARVKRLRKVNSLILSVHEWLIRKTGMKESMSNDTRDVYMIVATLVATATYQATLSPPGGFYQIDGPGSNNTMTQAHGPSNSSQVYAGKSVMSNMNFLMFSFTNMCAFLPSIFTIIVLMPRNVGWLLLYESTWLLAVSYLSSIIVISPNYITTYVSISIFFVLLPVLWVASFVFFTPRLKILV
ncbi:ankyrin repeat-containing protein BDA1-like [Phaseolus vulgaris]|uniref:ankyrin repeat-containing protein BDA1-like n=1 Tax=Phaseolus vulgaris TaxID=3885 RepID=UPI0035C970B9